MAKFKFFGISEADAAIRAADAAINPLLESAKITTIEVNGKPLAATSDDVPLAAKIAAFAATVKAGAADEQVSQLIANNSVLAGEATALRARAVSAESSNATLVSENAAHTGRIAILEKNVQTLTAENAEVVNLRKTANAETGRVTEQLNGVNSELSRVCLKHGVLTDLKGADGQLLPSTASQTDKETAANNIPAADKIKNLDGFVTSQKGQVNATLQKLNVDINAIPQAGAKLTETGTAKTELKGRARFIAAAKAGNERK